MDNQTIKQTILIVDDQPMNVDVLYGVLYPDYRVKVALNGEQALMLAASDPPPDMILLDIMMPGMDGYEVCRRLKANPFTRSIPLIFISALSEVGDESKGFEMGAVDYITKPVSPPLVRARVRTHLALYDQNRALETMVNLRTTELQRANQGLRQERARFEWMVQTVNEGYLILDKSGHLLFANPKSRLYLGLTSDQSPITENFIELVRRQYQLESPEAWEIPVTGTGPQGETQPRYLVRPETSTAKDFWLQVDILEMSTNGKGKNWVVRLRDVTDQVGSWRDRSAFTKMAHHKLRTPLATIVGGLDMIVQYAAEMTPEEREETTQFALAGAKRLQNTIEDVLAYLDAPRHVKGGSAEAGFQLERLPALLVEISVSMNIQDIAIDRDKSGLNTLTPLQTQLTISERAIELIFWELIENARKFHPHQSPRVTVRLADLQNGLLQVQVCDDGLSLSPEQLGQIWVPFYQGEKYFTGEMPGTGLGLAMVASLVWGAGGSCSAYNREDGPGLVVELCLPVRI